MKEEYKETEILISFPEKIIQQPEIKAANINSSNKNFAKNKAQTNVASNKAINSNKNILDESYQKELQEAQKLVNDVSHQLSKEIPTIADLQMPEETTEHMNPDSILNKLYNGDSNVEYYLKDRYHIRLPIPVYLSQYGGSIIVNIVVDQKGNVTEAEPVITNNVIEQQLSFAKTAAIRTKFNTSTNKESKQKGYIKYNFVAQ